MFHQVWLCINWAVLHFSNHNFLWECGSRQILVFMQPTLNASQYMYMHFIAAAIAAILPHFASHQESCMFMQLSFLVIQLPLIVNVKMYGFTVMLAFSWSLTLSSWMVLHLAVADHYLLIIIKEINLWMNKKNSAFSLLRPSIEISTKTHLLELSTVTHVVKNQIKWVIIY